jgi:hypothetical protein
MGLSRRYNTLKEETMGEINSPGPQRKEVGKPTSGRQDQGSGEDVMNYCDVNTGLGGSGAISTQMNTPLGKTPTGKKTGGL